MPHLLRTKAEIETELYRQALVYFTGLHLEEARIIKTTRPNDFGSHWVVAFLPQRDAEAYEAVSNRLMQRWDVFPNL